MLDIFAKKYYITASYMKHFEISRLVFFTGVVGLVVGLKDFCVIPWHFENGATSKIDYLLAEYGGLLHVLPLAVHLNFLMDK